MTPLLAARVCKHCGCWPCRCGIDPDAGDMPPFALRIERCICQGPAIAGGGLPVNVAARGRPSMTTLSDLYSEEAYLAAIAHRNITWCRWREADELLIEATLADRGRGLADLRPYVGHLNQTQNDYEHAARDLIKARVWFRAGMPKELPIAV